MASRFFHGGSSDSESESDWSSSEASSESGSSSQSSPSDHEQQTSQPQKQSAFSRFLRDEDSDDNENGGARVVRSARDKHIDELQTIVKAIDNAAKINDWISIQNEFEKMSKHVTKNAAKMKNMDGLLPRFFIKCLVDLEDALKAAIENKDARKKANTANAKALMTMKQKLRKYNQGFETQISNWRQNPVLSGSDESGDESSEDEQPAKPAAKAKPVGKNRFLKTASSDDSSEESDEESESDSDSEDESSDDDKPAARGIDRWKKTTSATTKKDIVKAKAPATKTTVVAKGKVAFESETDDGFTEVTSSRKPKTPAITSENLTEKLRELIQARGKKGTDRSEHIQMFEKLLGIASTPAHRIKVLLALIAARLDFHINTAAACMTTEMWKSAEAELNQLLDLVEKNAEIVVKEDAPESDTEEEDTNAEKKSGGLTEIKGSIVSLVSRFEDEFTKSLQASDPHSMEYIDRLKDEVPLYALIVRAEKYYDTIAELESVCRLKMMRLEHIYYKYNNVILLLEENARKLLPSLGAAPVDANQLIHSLCVYLYNKAPDRFRARSILFHVYHLALNKRYYEARDLLLMSHLQESIQQTDLATQILFNRVMTQLGICAFRCGMVKDCHAILNELMSSARTKELLAQGIQTRQQAPNAEAEKKERQRILPFHMHINVDLLDIVYLTVSMLLEIPNMALNAHDIRKKIISRPLRRNFEYFERQVFNGPPESQRDYVLQAARALRQGNWRNSTDLILSIKTWDFLPDVEEVKKNLALKIKQQGLRTYLFTFGSFYDTLGIEYLASEFEMSVSTTVSMISKMILNDELHASIDQPANVLTLHRVDPTRLQHMALQLNDKIHSFAENNEKLAELKRHQLHGDVEQPSTNRSKKMTGYAPLKTTNSGGFQPVNSGRRASIPRN